MSCLHYVSAPATLPSFRNSLRSVPQSWLSPHYVLPLQSRLIKSNNNVYSVWFGWMRPPPACAHRITVYYLWFIDLILSTCYPNFNIGMKCIILFQVRHRLKKTYGSDYPCNTFLPPGFNLDKHSGIKIISRELCECIITSSHTQLAFSMTQSFHSAFPLHTHSSNKMLRDDVQDCVEFVHGSVFASLWSIFALVPVFLLFFGFVLFRSILQSQHELSLSTKSCHVPMCNSP